MTVEVCTVWAPRTLHAKYDPIYLSLLDLQRRSAQHWGARHCTVTDDVDFKGAGAIVAQLPRSLMRAMIAGIMVRLERPVDCHLLFADVDVLIARELDPAFDGTFDLGLTRRANAEGIHINNGAMYVARGAEAKAWRFFKHALDVCGDHWGADQEAVSRAAAPVPEVERIEMRGDMRLSFLSMQTHNNVPKQENGNLSRAAPFVIHFKGSTKYWARTFAERHIFRAAAIDGAR